MTSTDPARSQPAPQRARIHFPAVLVAALAYFGIGATWFSLFQAQWLHAVGKTFDEAQAQASATPYLVAALADLVLALAVAWVVQRRSLSLVRSVGLGLLLGVGVIAPTLLTVYGFQYGFQQGAQGPQAWALFLVNSGAPVVGLPIMAAILSLWSKPQRAARAQPPAPAPAPALSPAPAPPALADESTTSDGAAGADDPAAHTAVKHA